MGNRIRPFEVANHRARRTEFAKRLSEAGFDAAVIMERKSVYYLTGTGQPCNLLVVPGRTDTLFARRVHEWVAQDAQIADIRPGASFREIAALLQDLSIRSGRIGFELDTLPAALYLKAVSAFSGMTIADCSDITRRQRMVKDEFEIARLREAAGLYAAVHQTMKAILKPGIRELDIAAELARALRLAGHEGVTSYRRWDALIPPEGLIASGSNLHRISGLAMTVTGVGLSPVLPWGASERVVEKGDILIVDLGLNRQGYHADMSRTYVAGRASGRIRELFSALLRCQAAAFNSIRPGKTAAAVFDAAIQSARDDGLADWFQGFGSQRGNYIGHGVGLDLDEPPVLSPMDATPLTECMALTVEPKFISPDFGAVQIEDTVLVTATGCETLGSTPRQLFEVFN